MNLTTAVIVSSEAARRDESAICKTLIAVVLSRPRCTLAGRGVRSQTSTLRRLQQAARSASHYRGRRRSADRGLVQRDDTAPLVIERQKAVFVA